MAVCRRIIVLCLILAAVLGEQRLAGKGATVSPNRVDAANVFRALRDAPVSFIPNRGQMDHRVRFAARCTGYDLVLTDVGMVMRIGRAATTSRSDRPLGAVVHLSDQLRVPQRGGSAGLRFRLLGASHSPTFAGTSRLPGRVNFFTGRTPGTWHTDIPTYAEVMERGVYPGIDLRYYGTRSRLEYDWMIAPGANPAVIRLQVQGAEGLRVDRHGNLLLKSGHLPILQRMPLIYQTIAGVRRVISGRYVLYGRDQVGFVVSKYNRHVSLIIDPAIQYSTYLGGSGDDVGVDVATDGAGNAYSIGRTNSPNWPTANPFQASPAGSDFQVFVTKLDPSGHIVYSTYLGGSAASYGNGIAADSAGNAYITGLTTSPNFPTANAFQSQFRGQSETFVAKLAPGGNALVYSTFLGGSAKQGGYKLALDGAGEPLVVGGTTSSNFPTANAAQPVFGGGSQDGFVTKLTADGQSLVFSTFLGGSNTDYVFAITLDGTGNAFVTGGTASTDFPTLRPTQASFGGGSRDAFVTSYSPAGALLLSTYLGGQGDDVGSSIAVDAAGKIFVGADSSSASLPPRSLNRQSYRNRPSGAQPDSAPLHPAGQAPAPRGVVLEVDENQGATLDDLTGVIDGPAPVAGAPQVNSVSRVAVTQDGKKEVVALTDAIGNPVDAHYVWDKTAGIVHVCFTVRANVKVGAILTTGKWIDAKRSTNGPGGRRPIPGLDGWSGFNGPIPDDNRAYIAYGGLDHPLPTGTQVCLDVPVAPGQAVPEIIDFSFSTTIYGEHVATVTATRAGSELSRDVSYSDQTATGPTHTLLIRTRLNGTTLSLSGFADLHANGDVNGSGLALDAAGNTYIAGATGATTFPVVNAAQAAFGGGQHDAYAVKLTGATPDIPSNFLTPATTNTPVASTATSVPPPTITPVPTPTQTKHSKKCKKGHKRVHGKCKKIKSKK